jgi:hypothetical protein
MEQSGSFTCHARAGGHPAADEKADKRILDSRLRECVTFARTLYMHFFVIPGLSRNPVLFQRVIQLDAGSGPA